MTWTPTYASAGLADPLIRQLIAFIQRDQRAALDWVGQDADEPVSLPDIVDYQLASRAVPQFPYVWLYEDEILFDQEAQGSRHYAVRIYCEVAVAHQDFQRLAILRRQYMRAIDAVLTSLPLSDFDQGWPLSLPVLGTAPVTTTPLAPASVMELFVLRHRTGRTGMAGTGFAASGLIEFTVEREEI